MPDHLGRNRRLVDEDEARHIKLGLLGLQPGTRCSDIGTILFGALPPATQVLDLRATAGANQEGTGLSVYEQDAPDAEDAAVSATATPATSPAPR